MDSISEIKQPLTRARTHTYTHYVEKIEHAATFVIGSKCKLHNNTNLLDCITQVAYEKDEKSNSGKTAIDDKPLNSQHHLPSILYATYIEICIGGNH